MRLPILLITLVLVSGSAAAQLKSSQARNLIRRVAGSELPGSAVKVEKISPLTDSTAEATADIQTAFRFEQDEVGNWRVRQVRVGPNRWESIKFVARASGISDEAPDCDGAELLNRKADEGDPSVKRSRCLLAALLGVQLPSDAVRIKGVSALGLPFVSQPSSMVTAIVRLDFRFGRSGKGGWQVTDLRAGNREWVRIDDLVARVNEEKRSLALTELKSVGRALEAFRTARGTYVVSDDERLLIDHLNPRYLNRVIRLDPWNHPYEYQGQSQSFTLRSVGPDGKQDTSDDIVLSSDSKQAQVPAKHSK